MIEWRSQEHFDNLKPVSELWDEQAYENIDRSGLASIKTDRATDCIQTSRRACVEPLKSRPGQSLSDGITLSSSAAAHTSVCSTRIRPR